MIYTIRTKNTIQMKNWTDRKRPDIINTSEWINETTDKETCIALLKETIDAPDYEITDENIIRIYELVKPGKKQKKISKDQRRRIDQVKKYYKFRKNLMEKMMRHLTDGDTGYFRYNIPEDCNHFEIVGDYPDKQEEAFIELEIYVD